MNEVANEQPDLVHQELLSYKLLLFFEYKN